MGILEPKTVGRMTRAWVFQPILQAGKLPTGSV